MNYRKFMLWSLTGTLMIQPIQWVYGENIQNVVVQTIEDTHQNQIDDSFEGVTQDPSIENSEEIKEVIQPSNEWPMTFEYVGQDVRWQPYITRLDTMKGEQSFLTPPLFAQMICYRLNLSPIKIEQSNGYIERLKYEGLWINDLEKLETVSNVVYESVMELVAQFNRSKMTHPFLKEVPAGFIKKSSLQAYDKNGIYTLYTLGDVNYICLSDLRTMGFNISEQEGVLKLEYEYLGQQVGEPENKSKALTTQIAKYNGQKVYIGNVLTYSLKMGDEVLVPLRSTGEYFDLVVQENKCTLVPNGIYRSEGVSLAPNKITNTATLPVNVEIISVFWNGKNFIEESLKIEDLQPGETYPLIEELYGLDEKVIHTSTMVKAIQREKLNLTIPYKSYGQHITNVMSNYVKNQNSDVNTFVSQLFPATQIIGTMKYATNGFEKGEKVVVWAAEDGQSYHLIKNGKKITVPWSSVSIPASPKACKEQVPTEVIEAYFNSLSKISSSPYYIWTDLYRQTTYVFKKQSGEWKLIRRMATSSGLNKTPTPTGEFKVSAYVPAFGMNKGYRCKNALLLFGDYLYHSVLYDVEGKYIISGMESLGERASHGCLRLSPEDSKWLYETMPLGTSVWIN
ncbi:L,D-transpeptidase [Niameybacter massiliensis]|uniref:L,D-transpeptidase n=1 Tax=Holtiella tumoricola TaxID=3018743 RepID=A0AA42DPE6_9FIRM|nr:L,D-transpeptidase [Holtiella tumoricola]MDA3732411.1 L,D-transpeptidase [Holtiella tumoricola]